MKKIIVFILIVSNTLLGVAQSTFSFGVRGGLDFLMPRTEQIAHNKVGGAGMFDLGYTYYWQTRNSGDWGIQTGLSVGYATDRSQLEFSQQYTNRDYLNIEMLYTTTGIVDVSLQRVNVEIPLMAAFRKDGFILQAGLKAQFAVWSKALQTLNYPSIDAYYVPFDVHVTDELITGIVQQEDMSLRYTNTAPFANLLLAARIGYEAQLGNNGRLGVAAYLDYNVLNMSSSTGNKPLIAVAPISDAENPVPEVTINNAFQSLITGIHPLQIGVSMYYAIELDSQRGYSNRSGRVSKSYKSNSRYRGNTRHRNNTRYKSYNRSRSSGSYRRTSSKRYR